MCYCELKEPNKTQVKSKEQTKHKRKPVRTMRESEVLKAVLRKIPVFWDVKPCRLVKSFRRFGRVQGLRLQDQADSEENSYVDLLDSGIGGTTLLRNVGSYLLEETK